MNLKFRAVLFDFDGVIANTMPVNFAAWQKTFETQGVSIDRQNYYLLEGKGPRQIALELCRKNGIDPVRASGIAKLKDSLIPRANSLAVYPEIPVLLQKLNERGVLCALVTGASRHRIESTLPSNIAAHFLGITTSDDVRNTKPDPEPYLTSAAKLGLKSDECIVIENAPLGIASAKAGGFYCIAIATTLAASHLEGASEILQNHSALQTRLLKMLDEH